MWVYEGSICNESAFMYPLITASEFYTTLQTKDQKVTFQMVHKTYLIFQNYFVTEI